MALALLDKITLKVQQRDPIAAESYLMGLKDAEELIRLSGLLHKPDEKESIRLAFLSLIGREDIQK